MSRPIKVTGPSDLIAAIPHVMGFVPHESVLVVPCSSGSVAAIVSAARVMALQAPIRST